MLRLLVRFIRCEEGGVAADARCEKVKEGRVMDLLLFLLGEGLFFLKKGSLMQERRFGLPGLN